MDFSEKESGSQAIRLIDGGPDAKVDADIIARACASAADGRQYRVVEDDVVYTVEKYKKDAIAFCKLNEFPLDFIQEHYKPEPIERCLHSVKVMFKSIVEAAGAGSYQGYLTGGTNFRNTVAKTAPYKGNRWDRERRQQERDAGNWIEWLDATEAKFKDSRRPEHFKACVKYLIKEFKCVVSEGEEADDLMGIDHMADLEHGIPSIICTIDKDLDMIPGDHYRWPIHGTEAKLYTVSEEEAMMKFYCQLLTGDTTDNIIGIKGIGGKTAYKHLKDCESEFEMYTKAVELYDGDFDRVLENARLLWIRRKEGELWIPPVEKETE